MTRRLTEAWAGLIGSVLWFSFFTIPTETGTLIEHGASTLPPDSGVAAAAFNASDRSTDHLVRPSQRPSGRRHGMSDDLLTVRWDRSRASRGSRNVNLTRGS